MLWSQRTSELSETLASSLCSCGAAELSDYVAVVRPSFTRPSRRSTQDTTSCSTFSSLGPLRHEISAVAVIYSPAIFPKSWSLISHQVSFFAYYLRTAPYIECYVPTYLAQVHLHICILLFLENTYNCNMILPASAMLIKRLFVTLRYFFWSLVAMK